MQFNGNKTAKRCAFGILILIVAVLAAATIVEKFQGTDFVSKIIYGSWWFVALWYVFAITSFIYIISGVLYRNITAFIMHIAFGIILFGAFITFLTAQRGYMHIRQGETSDTYVSEKDETSCWLPFDVKLVLFDIEYHPDTYEPADFISFLKIDNEICRVSMNKIYSHKGYRFYQADYDSDEMGTVLMINRDPLGIAITYTGYFLLTLSMLIILWIKLRWRIFYIFVSLVCLWYYISQLNPMTPVLRSPMLAAHVSVIMLSYALFVFIAATSLVGILSKRLRNRFYSWNRTLLYPALFMLAAGIFIGAVWANISWGRYWGWDAKETWALITMLVYAIPMHKNSFKIFRHPLIFHRYCACAFLAVAVTFFGVSYILGGIHSYI
ncbi:MAG: cytochrome c biogenesis protein CcsA [Prevotellaceae bacterium]|jgi:ABC-type transport system involved in cytochrome c biogenesis permease subunit|nr:cytochrome c biogenesis protein CcsA [Prevotellaceae bacterium]